MYTMSWESILGEALSRKFGKSFMHTRKWNGSKLLHWVKPQFTAQGLKNILRERGSDGSEKPIISVQLVVGNVHSDVVATTTIRLTQGIIGPLRELSLFGGLEDFRTLEGIINCL